MHSTEGSRDPALVGTLGGVLVFASDTPFRRNRMQCPAQGARVIHDSRRRREAPHLLIAVELSLDDDLRGRCAASIVPVPPIVGRSTVVVGSTPVVGAAVSTSGVAIGASIHPPVNSAVTAISNG